MSNDLLYDALGLAVLLYFAATLAGPAYWLSRADGDDRDYDPNNGMGGIPADDPMRSPDWCHAHGAGCGDEEK